MNIKKYRRFINVTQSDMAAVADISPSAYWYKEKGERPFTQDEMIKIHKYIKKEVQHVTIEELFFNQ